MTEPEVILVPLRGGDAHRDRLWRYVRRHYEALGLPIIEGHHHRGEGRFNRSKAINRAAEAAGDWRTALIIDADSLVSADQARKALALAEDTGRVALAFDHYHALNRPGTKAILAGHRGSWRRHITRTLTNGVSSALAVRRDLFDRALGFDEHFDGWGWEDVAFINAARTYAGPEDRIVGDVWHLWHPRSHDREHGHPAYQANKALVAAYRDAASDEGAMDALTGFTDPRGRRHRYFCHPYNVTFDNERTIEVPLALDFLESRPPTMSPPATFIEVGNVLSHYVEGDAPRWPVIDKYERGDGVTNVDVMDYKPARPADAIIAISTLEHVGQDERGEDPTKALAALDRMRSWLAPDGAIFLTVPLGHNPDLDAHIIANDVPGARSEVFWRREPTRNYWRMLNMSEPLFTPYDRQTPTATTLYVAEIGAP